MPALFWSVRFRDTRPNRLSLPLPRHERAEASGLASSSCEELAVLGSAIQPATRFETYRLTLRYVRFTSFGSRAYETLFTISGDDGLVDGLGSSARTNPRPVLEWRAARSNRRGGQRRCGAGEPAR